MPIAAWMAPHEMSAAGDEKWAVPHARFDLLEEIPKFCEDRLGPNNGVLSFVIGQRRD
jgi:hypothetical protein